MFEAVGRSVQAVARKEQYLSVDNTIRYDTSEVKHPHRGTHHYRLDLSYCGFKQGLFPAMIDAIALNLRYVLVVH